MRICTGVAPFTGAWIEISQGSGTALRPRVAPFTGAWIDIDLVADEDAQLKSLPSRERGLKFRRRAGRRGLAGRSLHGSVD